MEITVSVIDSLGNVRASKTGQDSVSLFFTAAYQPGDVLTVETSETNRFVTLSLASALGYATLFFAGKRLCFPVPFGEAAITYAPNAFTGGNHRISARIASPAQISAQRNLAFNPYDFSASSGIFPHATATVETRGEAAFAARNAIDGEVASDDHGFWPYTSWGINCDPDARLTVWFGRPVTIKAITLFTRADFPHDAWWDNATITLSDGWSESFPLRKTGAGQYIALESRQTEWVRLEKLIKADDPSPFPALTQIEIWGHDD